MEKIDKEKLLKKEIKSFKDIFKQKNKNEEPGISKEQLTLINKLCERAGFMSATLQELEQIINEEGAVELFEQGSQKITREHPAAKTYNIMIKNYNATVKLLSNFAPNEDVKDELLGFDRAKMTWLEEYGTAVLDGKIVACEKIKRIYEKLLNDLYHPGEYHFDEEIANRHIRFIETFCKQAQGKIGTPLQLELFQKARFQAAFGFVDDNDNRKYNEVLTIEGRKNGKTTECSAINIDMCANDHEGSPECYNIATAKDQANKGFEETHKMIRHPLFCGSISANVKGICILLTTWGLSKRLPATQTVWMG